MNTYLSPQSKQQEPESSPQTKWSSFTIAEVLAIIGIIVLSSLRANYGHRRPLAIVAR